MKHNVNLQGFRLVPIQDCWHKSLVPLMAEVREQMGSGPVYISFDVDGLDPAFAPGTGKEFISKPLACPVASSWWAMRRLDCVSLLCFSKDDFTTDKS